MPGAFAVAQADHGRVSLVEQGTAAKTLRDFDEPLTDHDDFDYELIEEHAQYIFDTRDRCRGRVVERL
ncbi:hypothetical protein ACPPVO_02545 [Dactylosporangium sp. McL0621]|uniref:hypothetical protein n=1 Tax=Dactylosporangium sp. McL0621 TaxID=3415678 RepID=UPI003CF49F6A